MLSAYLIIKLLFISRNRRDYQNRTQTRSTTTFTYLEKGKQKISKK